VAGVTPMVLPFDAAATAGFAAVAGVHAGAGGALEKKELRLVCPLTGANVFGPIFEILVGARDCRCLTSSRVTY
jgi:hypothetical protein